MHARVPWLCSSSRYNPECDSESRLLRHRAVALQDMAHSFLDHELSEDFEQVWRGGGGEGTVWMMCCLFL